MMQVTDSIDSAADPDRMARSPDQPAVPRHRLWAALRWLLVRSLKLIGETLYLALGTIILTRLGVALLSHVGVAPITFAITRDVAILGGLVVLTARLAAVRHPLGAFGLRAVRDAVAGAWLGLIVGPAALPALFGLPFTAQIVLDFAVFLALAALLSDLLSLIDTAIHEGGHVVAGLLVGYPPRSVRLGPVEIRRSGHGPRLAWSHAGSTDGSTEVIFRPKRWARLRDAVLSAAGALTSIAVAVLVWRFVDLGVIQRVEGDLGALGIAAFGRVFDVAGLTFVTVRVFVASAIAVSLFNLLPLNPSLDGASLLDALRGGPDFERGEALAELQEVILAGARPRDWPPALMARITAAPNDEDEPLPAVAYLMDYYVALDRGELIRANWNLDRLVATSWMLSPNLALEVAYFVARYRRDAALARVWLDRGPRRHEQLRTARAQAAILLEEGDAEKALAATEAGLKEIARQRATDGADAESLALPEDQLREMAAEARAALTVGVTITTPGADQVR
jgi:hypothetical protein